MKISNTGSDRNIQMYSLGSNKGRIVLLKSETLEVLQEIEVLEGKNCQIRSMVLSNNGQVHIYSYFLCICCCFFFATGLVFYASAKFFKSDRPHIS